MRRMFNFLMMVLLGAIWAFCIAMQIERPDLIAFIPVTNQLAIDGAFFALLVLAVVYVSWFEITNNHFTPMQIIQLLMRNLMILSLGVGLLVFTSTELLNGLDPTGRAPILGLTPQRNTPVADPSPTNPPQPAPDAAAH